MFSFYCIFSKVYITFPKENCTLTCFWKLVRRKNECLSSLCKAESAGNKGSCTGPRQPRFMGTSPLLQIQMHRNVASDTRLNSTTLEKGKSWLQVSDMSVLPVISAWGIPHFQVPKPQNCCMVCRVRVIEQCNHLFLLPPSLP